MSTVIQQVTHKRLMERRALMCSIMERPESQGLRRGCEDCIGAIDTKLVENGLVKRSVPTQADHKSAPRRAWLTSQF